MNPETASVAHTAPRADDMVAVFRVNNDDKVTMVAVHPLHGESRQFHAGKYEGWYHTMDEIHGDMMLGTAGDYLIETAASLDHPDDASRGFIFAGQQPEIHACAANGQRTLVVA